MKTYQDLLEVGEELVNRGKFCEEAVRLFKGTSDYQNASVAVRYYNKHNVTIERYQKYIYALSGAQHLDTMSANYKLKTSIFRRLVIQQVQYVLGNGVTLNQANKDKLGKDFDFKLQTAAKLAMVCGRSFGFWNYDHLEVFGYVETAKTPGFCPLYDRETSALKGGVRFWSIIIGDKMHQYFTLYDENGFTEYVKEPDEDVRVLRTPQKYKTTRIVTNAGVVEAEFGENYDRLPIVQLYASDTNETELSGLRENIDCYDLIKSGLANDIDDLSGFFWVIENMGGMEDYDLAKFIQRMKMTRAADVDTTGGGKVELHTQEVPSEARQVMLKMLRDDIYEDFQALDVSQLSAAAKTTQEIQAAYQNQDNKCADFEYYVLDFVQKILELANVKDNPTFVWNKVVNMAEQTNMILAAQNYLSEEAIIRHLPFLTPEEAEQEIKNRANEQMNQFGLNNTTMIEE